MKLALTLIAFLPFLLLAQTRIELTKINQVGNQFDVIAESFDQPAGYEVYLIRNIPEAQIEMLESGDTAFSVGVYDRFFLADTFDTQIWNVIASNYVTHPFFDFTISITPPSTQISFDGSVEMTFTNPAFLGVDEIYAAFNAELTGNFPINRVLTTEDSVVFRIYGFGPGKITLTGSIFDNPEFLFAEQFFFTFFSGSLDFELCNNQLQLDVSFTDPNGGCNGEISVTPVNPEGPVNYLWNQAGVGSIPVLTDLCQYNYRVMVYDSVGKCGSRSITLLNPLDQYTINDPLFGEGVQDTVEVFLGDCSFDFNAPIDSIVYVETQIQDVDFGNGNIVTYVSFDLTVYNGGNVIFWQTAYPTDNPENTLLSLYFICVQGDSVFCHLIQVNNQLAGLMSSTTTEVVEACGSYLWENGVVYTASTNTPWMVVEDSNGDPSIVELDLTIHPLPEVLAFDLGNGSIEATGGDEYQWFDCNLNQPISGAILPTFQATENGVYSVIAVNSITNCADTSDCITIDYLNLNEQALHSFNVYPNPTKNLVTVKTDLEVSSLTVYDVVGQKVFEGDVSNGSVISLEDFEVGMYVFIFENIVAGETLRIIKE